MLYVKTVMLVVEHCLVLLLIQEFMVLNLELNSKFKIVFKKAQFTGHI